MARLVDAFRGTFSFLFTRSSAEDRVAAYVIREHGRGRQLTEILEDPFVRNRLSEAQQKRLLVRDDVIHAVGQDVVESLRRAVP
jgi:hypothetical protein